MTSAREILKIRLNRYRRKRPKVDATIFDSALSHTRRLEASEKKEKKIACPLLDVFACGQVSSPRLNRLMIVDNIKIEADPIFTLPNNIR